MVVVLDPQVAFQPVSGVLQIGVGPTTISAVNLGALGAQTSGPIGLTGQTRSYSIQQPDGADAQLRVGETFSITNTVTNTATGAVVGTPQSTSFTVLGSGTVTGLLGTPRNVILASGPNGQQFMIFPNNIPPNLLGAVTISYNIQEAGYDFDAVPPGPICFARGTMLQTPEGLRVIEDLKVGDLVETKDHGAQPVRWIGSRTIDAAELARHDNLRPIRIKAGALGHNTPSSDLVVSPQHRILIRSKIAIKMFDSAEVLVAAKQLLQLDGVDIAQDMESVEYFHMLFEQHEVVFSNGAETESLFTGSEALKSVGAAALEEIYTILPQVKEDSYEAVGARPLLSGRDGRKLARRHIQNHRDLVS